LIVVNPSTRQFNIPGADLVFGVEDDSGSVVKEFQCSRYVGNNLDLASAFIRMNYRNANGEIDSYLVKGVTVDGENIVFGWELSPKVTMYKGNVSFVMCVVGPDTKVKWHTTLGRGQVLEGLEPDSAMVEEGTADVVAALIAMVEAQTVAVENKGAEWVRNVQSEGTDQIVAVQTAGAESKAAAVAEIEAKGVNVRESIPDDYTALSEAVDSLTRGRAGAIVCEVEGSAVAVNDASDNYLQSLRIFGQSTQNGTPTPEAPVEIESIDNPVVRVCGKNILPYPYDETSASQNGMTLIPQEDGGIAVSGTPTGYVDLYLYDGLPLAKSGNVTISIHGVFENVTASLGFHDATGATIGSVNAIPEGRNYITVNLDDYPTVTRWVVLIKRVNNNQPVSGVVYPQIELGEIATEYKPYTGNTIETAHPLRGISVTSGGNYTDSNGQQWICDEVNLERGVLVKRVNEFVIDGTFTGNISRETEKEKTQVFLVVLPKPHPEKYRRDFFSNRFVSYVATDDAEKMVPNLNSVYVALNKERLTELSVAGFRAWVTDNPITMYYAQETPEEIPLSETEIAAYRAMHTNYPNTTVLNDSGAHMVVKYAADTKLYIDNKITALIGG
jgi:hypothetical protein